MRWMMLLCCLNLTFSAELLIDTDSTVVTGGTYDHIEITARYVTLRNVTVRNTTGTNYYAAVYLHGSKYTTVENCVIDGGALAVSGEGSCGGIKLDGASRAKITGNTIYNMNDDGIRMYSSSLSDITGNTIYMLISCGTDNGCSSCNNGHSDGIQAIYCTKVNILNNLIYDVRGTSALFMGNNPNQTCRFVTVANNIMFTPEAGYTAYLQYSEDFDVFNNVIVGGAYGSIWYGTEMYRFRFQNNICGMHKLKDGGTYVPEQHTVSYNLWAELHPYYNLGVDNLTELDPQFAGVTIDGTARQVTREDFALQGSSPCIDAGILHDGIPTLDIYDNFRDGMPDMGAIEYGGVSGMTPASDLPVLDDLEVSPLPMADHLTFTAADLQNGPFLLQILTPDGRPMARMAGSGMNGTVTWDATGVRPGLYVWTIEVDGHRQTGTVIKSYRR